MNFLEYIFPGWWCKQQPMSGSTCAYTTVQKKRRAPVWTSLSRRENSNSLLLRRLFTGCIKLLVNSFPIFSSHSKLKLVNCLSGCLKFDNTMSKMENLEHKPCLFSLNVRHQLMPAWWKTIRSPKIPI